MGDVTRIMARIESGDAQAADELLPLVYGELRKLAAARLAAEKPGQTLQATALVHEAYLRLVGPAGPAESDPAAQSGDGSRPAGRTYENSRHFFAAAAESMRRILIETARRKQSRKHGGGLQRHDLDGLSLAAEETPNDVLALDAALKKLAAIDKPAADVVELRFFAGLPLPEVARLLEISPRTADRLWAYAKAWLQREISGQPTENSKPIVA